MVYEEIIGMVGSDASDEDVIALWEDLKKETDTLQRAVDEASDALSSASDSVSFIEEKLESRGYDSEFLNMQYRMKQNGAMSEDVPYIRADEVSKMMASYGAAASEPVSAAEASAEIETEADREFVADGSDADEIFFDQTDDVLSDVSDSSEEMPDRGFVIDENTTNAEVEAAVDAVAGDDYQDLSAAEDEAVPDAGAESDERSADAADQAETDAAKGGEISGSGIFDGIAGKDLGEQGSEDHKFVGAIGTPLYRVGLGFTGYAAGSSIGKSLFGKLSRDKENENGLLSRAGGFVFGVGGAALSQVFSKPLSEWAVNNEAIRNTPVVGTIAREIAEDMGVYQSVNKDAAVYAADHLDPNGRELERNRMLKCVAGSGSPDEFMANMQRAGSSGIGVQSVDELSDYMGALGKGLVRSNTLKEIVDAGEDSVSPVLIGNAASMRDVERACIGVCDNMSPDRARYVLEEYTAAVANECASFGEEVSSQILDKYPVGSEDYQKMQKTAEAMNVANVAGSMESVAYLNARYQFMDPAMEEQLNAMSVDGVSSFGSYYKAYYNHYQDQISRGADVTRDVYNTVVSIPSSQSETEPGKERALDGKSTDRSKLDDRTRKTANQLIRKWIDAGHSGEFDVSTEMHT